MNTQTHPWARLWWKEWRQTWLLAALIVALAPLAALAHALDAHFLDNLQYAYYAEIVNDIAFGLALVLLFTSAIWRIVRQEAKTPISDILPISAPKRWVATYVYPLYLPVLAGLVMGGMANAGRIGAHASPTQILLGVVHALALFITITAIVSVFSVLPAVCGGMVWFFTLTYPDSWAVSLPWYGSIPLAGVVAHLVWMPFLRKKQMVVGRFVAGVVFFLMLSPMPLLLGKVGAPRHPASAQVAAVPPTQGAVQPDRVHGVVIVGAGFIRAAEHWDIEKYLDQHYPTLDQGRNDEAHWREAKAHARRNTVLYRDGVTGEERTLMVSEATYIVTYLDQRQEVILYQWRKGNKSLRVVGWQVQTGAVRDIARLPVAPSMRAQGSSRLGWIGSEMVMPSPDQRYLCVTELSQYQIPRGLDLWLVDIERGGAKLLLPDCGGLPEGDGGMRYPIVSWQDDRVGVVINRDDTRVMTFDLPSGKARVMALNGGAR